MNLQTENLSRKTNIKTSAMPNPLSLKKSLVAILILSLAGFFIQSVLQNGFFNWMHFVYIIYPAIVVLNVLPVFLLMSAVYFICGRIWISCVVAYVPLALLNIANFYKTMFRDEPLKMSDLQLVSEMQNITQNYEIKLTFGIAVAIIIAVVAVVFAAKRLKSEKLKPITRVIGVISTICCMVLSYHFIYTNKQIYEGIPTFANEYHDTSMAKHHGMLYTLLVSSSSATYDMPEGYSDQTAEELLAESASAPVADSDGEKINVIAIMGEAFFDVNRGGIAQFEEGMNPYENYEKIKEEGYSGKLVVPGFGGSTESTEFEFLTGTSQYLLDNSMPTAYKTYITQQAYGLVQYFKDNGYRAVAIHPGYEWFYNRKSAYAYLGFDDFITREDMGEDAPKIYGYIEDSFTTEQILNEYLDHYKKSPQTPYFNFTVTIQNHGPYPDFDYGRDIIYKRPENISDENYYIINNYLNGVRDTDELLGDICEFADGREEPVAVLFFGDHLPYLDENIECFDALGYNISHKDSEGLRNKYTVEYVMWANGPARSIIEKSAGEVKMGKGPEISSNFLGTEFLNYLGMDKSSYFEFVDKVSEKVTVISPNYYKADDKIVTEIDSENAEILKRYEFLQYYNLRRYNKVDK